jgi:hypothetical protein
MGKLKLSGSQFQVQAVISKILVIKNNLEGYLVGIYNSNPKKETQTNKSGNRPVKKTRGEIGVFNRGVWNYMLKQFKLTEAQLVQMKEAICPAKINGMPANLIRYFNLDIAKEKGITVNDYESLNEHPELILYEGYYVRGKGGQINIKKWEGVGSSVLEETIKNGSITEIGVVIEKSTTQKWLSRTGNFMAMGGFMLVLIVIVVLVVVISLWSKNC